MTEQLFKKALASPPGGGEEGGQQFKSLQRPDIGDAIDELDQAEDVQAQARELMDMVNALVHDAMEQHRYAERQKRKKAANGGMRACKRCGMMRANPCA